MNGQLQESLKELVESATRFFNSLTCLVDLAAKKLEQEQEEQEDGE